MRYLIITTDPNTGKRSAFYTNWYSHENCYVPELNMIVVDTKNSIITFDGEHWEKIEFDYL